MTLTGSNDANLSVFDESINSTERVENTFHLALKGLSLLSDGRVALLPAAARHLAKTLDAIEPLLDTLGACLDPITFDNDGAVLTFGKPSYPDLFKPNWAVTEQAKNLSKVLARTTGYISERAQSPCVPCQEKGQPLQDIDGLPAELRSIVETQAEKTISKLVRAGANLSSDGVVITLPTASELPRVTRKAPGPREATIRLDAVSEDGQTGYDTQRHVIALAGVKNARPGEKFTGPFQPIGRCPFQVLNLVVGSAYQRTGVDGDVSIEEFLQQSLF